MDPRKRQKVVSKYLSNPIDKTINPIGVPIANPIGNPSVNAKGKPRGRQRYLASPENNDLNHVVSNAKNPILEFIHQITTK